MHLHLHPFTRERKKKTQKKKTKTQKTQKKKRKRKTTQKKKTKTHIFKNEDAYFKNEDATKKKKTKTKTRILGEQCQLSSGEYSLYVYYTSRLCYKLGFGWFSCRCTFSSRVMKSKHERDRDTSFMIF